MDFPWRWKSDSVFCCLQFILWLEMIQLVNDLYSVYWLLNICELYSFFCAPTFFWTIIKKNNVKNSLLLNQSHIPTGFQFLQLCFCGNRGAASHDGQQGDLKITSVSSALWDCSRSHLNVGLWRLKVKLRSKEMEIGLNPTDIHFCFHLLIRFIDKNRQILNNLLQLTLIFKNWNNFFKLISKLQSSLLNLLLYNRLTIISSASNLLPDCHNRTNTRRVLMFSSSSFYCSE